MKLLIVGKTSFISNSLVGDRISFSEIDSVNFDNYDSVINCSIHSNFREVKYVEKYDLDYLVAQKAQHHKKHYIMISSSKVYGSSDELKSFDELSQTNPDSFYGENKLIAEQKINSLSNNFCVLRCSNVFGLERNRKTFFGFCNDQLVNTNSILYDIGPKTKRDFFPVELLSNVVEKISKKKSVGTFNVGSNYPLEIDRVALYLIEGYGKGNFISISSEEKDQFLLNNKKLKKEIEIEIDIDFASHIKNIGKKLCKTL